ncbi:IncF plasmid conjugative transfer pilus assembly protein TraC [Dissulfuribacter thermophilus]|uniref:IncF plasmid conjugative transfer pilus assembly protein TraC n=1 Tax=Dissulfuribacter thermophilus TaxID=1156395 RepID=A0A1B9F611_9BACT|nr:TraC family protein [Dissulfuribacter thermophilus]OCC15313.1 IncF plasmid conjugative transfer pilus assembly protein TraC [Dissulfuribacter thermophilus]
MFDFTWELAEKFGLSERFGKKLDHDRLADFLPYRAWDPENYIFLLDHGKENRIGWFFVSEVTVPPKESFLQEFESLLSVMPPKSTVQILMAQMPFIGETISDFLKLRNRTKLKISEEKQKVLTHMMAEKAKLYRKLTEGLQDSSYPLLLKKPYIFFSFTVSPSELTVDNVISTIQKTKSVLQTAGFDTKKGVPADLYNFIYFLFSDPEGILPPSYTTPFKACLTNKKYKADSLLENLFIPLSELISPPSIGIKITSDTLLTNANRFIATVSYRQYPDAVEPGMVDRLVGDNRKTEIQLPYTVIHVLNIYVPDQISIKSNIANRHAVAAWQTFGPLAKFNPKVGKVKDDLAELMNRAEKELILKAYLHTIVLANSEKQLEEATYSYITHAKRHGFLPVRDKFVMAPLLLNSLPMGLYPDEAPKLFRTRTLSSSMIGCLAPVHAEGGSFGKPYLLFSTRRGYLITGDIFASPQGYNGLIFGGTGGGKSFFLNELTASYFSAGAKIIILDVGKSFKKLCEMLDGEYINFEDTSNVNINPFAHLSDDPELLVDDMEMLKNFVESMAAPKKGLTDFQMGALTEIIADVAEKYKQETTFDLIAEKLAQHSDHRIKDIATMLKPWCKGGENYRWVAGGKSINFESDLIVIEMEALMQRTHLQKVSLYYLMYRISQDFLLKTMKDPSFRKKPKFLFIDEAWEALKTGTADFIERAYRRFRKTGSGCWIITQGPSDLDGSAVADALWNNSHFVVSLRVENFNKEKAKKYLSDYALSVIPTLKTVKGQFSEIYMKTPFGEDILRFYAPRYTQLVYTTDATESAIIEKLLDEGLSYDRALRKIIAMEKR